MEATAAAILRARYDGDGHHLRALAAHPFLTRLKGLRSSTPIGWGFSDHTNAACESPFIESGSCSCVGVEIKLGFKSPNLNWAEEYRTAPTLIHDRLFCPRAGADRWGSRLFCQCSAGNPKGTQTCPVGCYSQRISSSYGFG